MATIVLDFEEDHFIQVRAINYAGESDNASLLWYYCMEESCG